MVSYQVLALQMSKDLLSSSVMMSMVALSKKLTHLMDQEIEYLLRFIFIP